MELQEVDILNPLALSAWPEESTSAVMVNSDGQEPLKTNLWGFFAWREVKEQFETIERLYAAIQDLRDEIRILKEKYRQEAIDLPDLDIELNTSGGISGSYFLIDEQGHRKYVIKPLDEDAGCIHSPSYSSPLNLSPFRDYMPLYRSSMREVLAYRVAQIIGTSSVVPKTDFVVIESETFHDLGESVLPDERKRYEEMCGQPDKEKLCSAQEFVENSKSLFEALHDFQMDSLSDEEIAARFDQKDFEEMNILIWTTYDTDAHGGNILVYPKGVDEIGNEILGLKKIDNGLAFPDKNKGLRNNLSLLPNAELPLSESAKAKVLAIDPDLIAEAMEKMGLEGAIPAMRERIEYLKEIVNREGVTIKDVNREMSKLGKKL